MQEAMPIAEERVIDDQEGDGIIRRHRQAGYGITQETDAVFKQA